MLEEIPRDHCRAPAPTRLCCCQSSLYAKIAPLQTTYYSMKYNKMGGETTLTTTTCYSNRRMYHHNDNESNSKTTMERYYE